MFVCVFVFVLMCVVLAKVCKPKTLWVTSTRPEIHVFDLTTGNLVRVLEEHKGWITCIEMFDNTLMLSASEDKSICIWNVGTFAPLVCKGHQDIVTCLTRLEYSDLFARFVCVCLFVVVVVSRKDLTFF